jgi:putative tricarboxylic transport membrane protein
VLRAFPFLIAGLLWGIAPAGAASEWRPDKRVEFIVPSSAGGGNDRITRLAHKLIQDGRLSDAVITVVNKVGGGGAVGWAYLNQHPGDGHYLAIASMNLVVDHIVGRATVSHNDVTPVVQLLSEYVGFAVKPESRIKTGKDLMAMLRADAGSVSFSIAGTLGNHNHTALSLVARASGADVRKLKVAVFSSGGDSITAALGGHVDLVVTPAATALPHVQSGRLRFIAVTAARRQEGALADVPAWPELGANAVISNWRVMIGPREMAAPQIAYWEGVFAKMVVSDDWKKMVARDVLSADYRRSAETREFLRGQYEEQKTVLTDLGLVKQ